MKYWQPYGITDPDAPYINGDPSIGRQGSIPPAGSIEQDQREIVNLIKAAGLTPREDDVTQMLQGVRSQRMNYALASGSSANQIHVAFNPTIADSMTPGMPLRIKTTLNNTGPCTLVIDSVEHPLRRSDGTELNADDVISGIPFECLWNDAGYWVMTNYRGMGGTGGSTTNTYITKIPYAVDTGTPNNIVANFTPPITAPVPGDAIEVNLANNITGSCLITVNGLAPVALVRPNGAPMQNGDGAVGQVALMLRSATGTWQFSGIIPQAFSGYGLPIGCIVLALGNTAPPGTLKLNGAIYPRADHPGLWTYANASNRIVNESDWQASASKLWTAFSRGDGTTNFRVPEFRAEFMRFHDDGRNIDQGRLLTTQQGEGVGPITLAGDIRIVNPYANVTVPGFGYTISPEAPLSKIMNYQPDLPSNVMDVYMFPAGGVGYDTPVSHFKEAYIRGNVEFHASGGTSETRARNAAVTACIVDG